jgi:hypothetical protein
MNSRFYTTRVGNRHAEKHARLFVFHLDSKMAYEQQFNSLLLEVVVPDASIKFPSTGVNGDAWYAQLKADTGERTTAFFGEVCTPSDTDLAPSS